MITVNGKVITPTIFPDGTSQVWKTGIEWEAPIDVVWYFEHEREIIDLASIATLHHFAGARNLSIPYLPYARQDKKVSDETTFNLEVFAHFLNGLDFNRITTFDSHSDKAGLLIEKLHVTSAVGFHSACIWIFKPDYILYPDFGAFNRYFSSTPALRAIVCGKERNQETGAIEKIVLDRDPVPGSRILMIDDICDGGATFTKIADLLAPFDCHIALAVSHGIFSKGKEILAEAGIRELFTTNSILKNKDGFPV